MMFDQKLIFTGEKFSIKDEVIQYLANKAQEVGKLDSCESYIAAVKKREQEFSTAIGYGVAIPHGSDSAVKESFVAVMTLSESMSWDNNEVNMIFMIGVSPLNRTTDHLKILSHLARDLMHDDFRNEVLKAKDSEELFNILKKREEDL